jgi:hypothetical protein
VRIPTDRRIRYRVVVALVVALAWLGFGVTPAHAAAPTSCVSTSDMPRTYTHGSPLTGLVVRHGYYYLDVKEGSGCMVPPGPNAIVQLVGTVQVRRVLPAVGDLARGVPPASNRDQAWWLEFHKDGVLDHGIEQQVTMDNNSHITWSDDVMKCKPDTTSVDCFCAEGSQTETFRYDGPDIFRLDLGYYVRLRIANEGTDSGGSGIVTDFATLTVHP